MWAQVLSLNGRSTPSIIWHLGPVPPPINIKVSVINNSVVELVQWEIPVLGGGDNEETMATEEPTIPEV